MNYHEMKIIFLILALLPVYVAVKILAYFYRVRPNLRLPSPDQSDEVLGAGPVLKYIAAGDSIGVGIGASSKQNTCPYKIAQFFTKTNKVEYKNISVGGFTTRDVIDKQISQIISYQPNIVVICVGGNDAKNLVSARKVLQNYQTIIAKLEQGTKAKIYLSNLPNFNGARTLPFLFIKLIELRSKSLNPQLLALETERTKIVNVHDFGWSSAPYNNRKITYAADHFHPNDLGYQNWTNSFLSRF